MAYNFDGAWSFSSFYSSTDDEAAPTKLTPWFQNARLQANTDETGSVTGYLTIGYKVLSVLGKVTQPPAEGKNPTVSLTCRGVGALYQIDGQYLVAQQSFMGELRCLEGDFDRRPNGATGPFIMSPQPQGHKLPSIDTGQFKIADATRFDDVEEVLSRDDVFFVTYEKKMRAVPGGDNFFLGMQNSPEHQQDVANMRSVVRNTTRWRFPRQFETAF